MVSMFQMGPGIIRVSIALGISLIIITLASLKMIEKKRLGLFMPFFIFGLGICLLSGFMFYDFFGIAVGVFYVVSFVVSVWIFFNLWRQVK